MGSPEFSLNAAGVLRSSNGNINNVKEDVLT